jgi:light-regulated signal transduction histidine kinase (bacteriophytochrome)
LRGSLELALRTQLSAQESRAALEQAFELTDLVVHLITTLRELAEAAMTDAPPKHLSLRDLVKETVEELQGLADSRGVKTLLEASLETIVCAPPDRLRQALLRLLCLVIQRSSDQGEIRLALSARGEFAGFLIADQRPSLAPGEFDLAPGGTAGLGRLFAEATKNHWLEWAVVKVLAESLGGTLQVMPRAPQGYCFLLQVPMANTEEKARGPSHSD